MQFNNKKIAALFLFIAIFLVSACQKPKESRSSDRLFSTTPVKSFVRISTDANGNSLSLDTAVASYETTDGRGLKVDLIGAVHFGEIDYYANLNQDFKQYDALLYELVGPKDHKPNIQQDLSSLGKIQLFIADLLTLQHQLYGIDYQADNFVHADSSFDDLKALAEKRGDTVFTIISGVIQDMLKMSAKLNKEQKNQGPTFTETLGIISDPVMLKQHIAQSLIVGENQDMLDGFATLGPYIVASRNDQALSVLKQEIDAGKTKIGIFYGAAHLKDFEKKLFTDFNLQRTNLKWLRAWDLTQSTQTPKNEVVQVIKGIEALMKLVEK